MSRKHHNKPEFHEPVEAVVVEVDGPLEDTIEVGEVILVDGPLDPVPLSTSPRDFESYSDYDAPRSSAGPMPDFSAPDMEKSVAPSVTDKAQDVAQGIGDKVQDAAQGAAAKATDIAQDVSGKAQDVAQGVTQKAQDVAQDVTGKAQDVAQKVTEGATAAKSAVGGALDTAKTTVTAQTEETKSAVSVAASKVGSSVWILAQRNPLQFLLALVSLIWLFRNNAAAASQPVVSPAEVGDKVTGVAGQVQVAAGNLGNQVQEQAQRGAGWFGQTLQTNPLAIGAMAALVGAALGFSVPETPYEDKVLGQTRDKLVGKAQEAAQDLTQKVTTVAQTAVHSAVETAKEEAKNQGLSAEALSQPDGAPQGEPPPPAPEGQDQSQQQY